MKRNFLVLLSLLISLNPSVYAQSSVIPAPVQTHGATSNISAVKTNVINRVGVAAAVRGRVEATQPGSSKRSLISGGAVFVNDEISTEADSGLQILFSDETSFTIGANSVMTIDEYVYDPSNREGKVTTSVSQGVFRFISGAIAKKNPENMNIKLPGAATLGVRGTIAAGETDGTATKVILMGPGANNNTGDKIGSVIVGNQVDGKMSSVHLKKNGFATKIDGPGQPPSTPYQVSASELENFSKNLNPPTDQEKSEDNAGGQGDSGPSATRQAGQDTFAAAKDLSAVEGGKKLAGRFQQQSDVSALEQVRSTGGGVGHIRQASVPFNQGGAYTINVLVDFNNRTVGGGLSRVVGTASYIDPDPFLFNLPTQTFPKDGKDVVFSNIPDAGVLCSACTANVTLHAVLPDPKIGSLIQHTVEVSKSALHDTGSGTAKIESGPL